MKPRGTLEDGIRQIPGLKFIEPKINLLVIYSDDYDLMPVIEQLRGNGWVFPIQTVPPPISMCIVTIPQVDGQIEVFLDNLKKNMRLAVPIKSKADMKEYEPVQPVQGLDKLW